MSKVYIEGDEVKHRLTGAGMMVVDVGPKARNRALPDGSVFAEQYLPRGMLRVRLEDMRIVDVYEFEIDDGSGISRRGQLLMEKS